ncbi:AsnC family transcriptional regulator [Halegenticoccus soli]|uniref:AsnC family transcriptional regulator n=1 Tax=Halegenticoccus soli TaxID=1985678 RepID=UPI000C6EC2B8|nr:AsnC family transcriptional regulator [Halegenticoccus soli]
MRTLDDTDIRILRLLTEDARRPYRDIAERVGLSSPAVSDRVTRLRDLGIIRRFTLDLDRSALRGGVPALVELRVRSDAAEEVRDALAAADGVEHVFVAAEPRVFFQARLARGDARTFLAETLGATLDVVADYDVTVLTDARWTPQIGGTDLALTCAECGNEVGEDGATLRLDGDLYHLCCPSCEERFRGRYERFSEGARAE